MDCKLTALLGLFLIWLGSCDSKMVFKMKKIECLPDPQFVMNSVCVVKAVNWNKAVAQMDCDLIRPLRNLSIRIQVFKQDYSNQYQPFLINSTVNMCQVLSKKNFSAYGKIVQKLSERFSNFNHSCPYEGHLVARDLYIDESLLPVFPLGVYKISVYLMENHINTYEYVGEINAYVTAIEEVPLNRRKPKNN